MANCFGKLVLGPSTKELIESGWLSPIVTFAPAMQPDLSGLRVRAGNYEQEALAQRMMAGTITGNAVAEYTRLAPQLPGLAFCVSVAHSQSVAAAFCAAGYKAVRIDGDTPRSERQALIEALAAGQFDLVTNCMIFSEGSIFPARHRPDVAADEKPRPLPPNGRAGIATGPRQGARHSSRSRRQLNRARAL